MLPHWKPQKLDVTYSAQSTAIINVMSSVGSPTEVSTMTIVTRPACGIPAAPMLAAVAVILWQRKKGISFTDDGLLCKKPHHDSIRAFLNNKPSYTSPCADLPVFCGQEPGQRGRTSHSVCPVLNSHPPPLQPRNCQGSSVVSEYPKCRERWVARLGASLSYISFLRVAACHESASTHHCFTLGSRAASRHLWVITGSACTRQICGWLGQGL